ncbi:MAG TPA: TetR/AcrR family transcriptional regulator [Myxococcota bacterium]|nr:TetR/AcrR family transcriptional regulator [Myxococcota bacterium]
MTRRSFKKLEAEGVGTSDDGLDVRARILDRTIYLMGKQGTTDVTVRAIAHEAGVNVAAVNYYFSSKERMISLMAERFRTGFEAVMALLADEDVELEQRLRRWAASVVGFLAEYPGILTLMERQLVAQPLDAFGETLCSAMQSAIQQLEAVLQKFIGVEDEQRLAFKLTLFISTLAGPYPSKFDQRSNERGYRAPIQQAEFLDLLIEHLKQ